MSKKKVRCYYCKKKEVLTPDFEEIKEGNNLKYFHKDCGVLYKEESK
jgi:hypothetical protein